MVSSIATTFLGFFSATIGSFSSNFFIHWTANLETGCNSDKIFAVFLTDDVWNINRYPQYLANGTLFLSKTPSSFTISFTLTILITILHQNLSLSIMWAYLYKFSYGFGGYAWEVRGISFDKDYSRGIGIFRYYVCAWLLWGLSIRQIEAISEFR